MDASMATIFCAFITTAGAVIVAKVGARSKAENQEIMERLERLEQRQISSELETARTDLIQSLEIDPDNSAEIMKIAKRYFLDLGGNSYASKPFACWAIKYCVDISELYTKRNDLEFYVRNPEIVLRP